MKNRLLVIFLLGLAAVMLSACSGEPKASPTLTPAPSMTETPRPSETPIPTSTQTATAADTATSTQLPTATQTAIPSETPRPSFAGFSVDYSEYTGYGLTISFRIPGIKDAYRLLVNKLEYKCQLNDKAPDRLFCNGTQFPVGTTVALKFLPPATGDTVIFEATYKIAPIKTPTPDPKTLGAQASGSCPKRGQDASCEAEYRNDGKGYYCIVATCSDACGYWYSMDTCPLGSEHNGIYDFHGKTPPLPPSHK